MPIGAIGFPPAIIGASTTGGVMGSSNTTATDGAGFGNALSGAVDNLQGLSSASNELSIQAVNGSLDDIHTATIASTRAQLTMELVAAIRNKGVDAFNEIMRMQA
ncbi:flagellar hook-basal body complex protein FliE [Cryobacterium sp. Y50]|uniref:flagellar hook-basal body complex protein FliE n=1 Tax=Cryobacterium sp. Y50 TaxID=2048286 RepID=UPI000CE36D51|nr:flagellar hook-basal body complex protein FliE [Cryobacterium sp. Y50]